MKNTIKNLIDNDTSYNKSVTRYLYKTHPELWQEILDATNFLPSDAKPKQRVWHILNDTYTRPTCPITREYVKWYENRYLGTINLSAKTKLSHQKGLYVNCYTNEANAKRKNSINEGFASGRINPHKWTPEEIDSRYKKIKATMLEKYGVTSNLLLKENKEKEYQTKVARGLITPIEQRAARDLYYAAVLKFTKQSWINHFDKINPSRIHRDNSWHLDHIYSTQQGFRNNIPPYIIGHWTNLRMMSGPNNSSKGMKCAKTKKQLFEDFFR